MNKNNKTALNILCIVVGMLGLAYASVPLYDLFCRVTGFGGQTVESKQYSTKILDREVTVLFSADVNPELPWEFKPVQSKMKVKIGENALAFYEATNISNETVIGTSTYNLTPIKAASYFNKVECFCFQQQEIAPNEKIIFPVSFFIDPEMVNDSQLNEVNTVTLSYTFFKYKE